MTSPSLILFTVFSNLIFKYLTFILINVSNMPFETVWFKQNFLFLSGPFAIYPITLSSPGHSIVVNNATLCMTDNIKIISSHYFISSSNLSVNSMISIFSVNTVVFKWPPLTTWIIQWSITQSPWISFSFRFHVPHNNKLIYFQNGISLYESLA